jgi:hypothetical protein
MLLNLQKSIVQGLQSLPAACRNRLQSCNTSMQLAGTDCKVAKPPCSLQGQIARFARPPKYPQRGEQTMKINKISFNHLPKPEFL